MNTVVCVLATYPTDGVGTFELNREGWSLADETSLHRAALLDALRRADALESDSVERVLLHAGDLGAEFVALLKAEGLERWGVMRAQGGVRVEAVAVAQHMLREGGAGAVVFTWMDTPALTTAELAAAVAAAEGSGGLVRPGAGGVGLGLVALPADAPGPGALFDGVTWGGADAAQRVLAALAGDPANDLEKRQPGQLGEPLTRLVTAADAAQVLEQLEGKERAEAAGGGRREESSTLRFLREREGGCAPEAAAVRYVQVRATAAVTYCH